MMYGEEEKTLEAYEHEVAEAGLRHAWEQVASSEAGKRVLFDLMSRCHVMISQFSPDPCVHAFNAGKQDGGLEIVRSLEAISPRAFPNLLLAMASIRELDGNLARVQHKNAQPEEPEDE